MKNYASPKKYTQALLAMLVTFRKSAQQQYMEVSQFYLLCQLHDRSKLDHVLYNSSICINLSMQQMLGFTIFFTTGLNSQFRSVY